MEILYFNKPVGDKNIVLSSEIQVVKRVIEMLI